MATKPLIIGLVGGSGSGKTTVARAILDALGGVDAAFIDQDAYYKDLHTLSLEERAKVNFDHPESLDNDLLVAPLTALANGVAIVKPTYDFAHHTRADKTIRDHPYQSIGGAFGVGLLIGVLVTRK